MDNSFLNNDRTIFITGTIEQDENSENIKKNIIRMATEKPNQPINIIIDSDGGDSFTAISIAELMLLYESIEFRVIVSGECVSAAFFIYLAGTTRYAFPHSIFMTHNALLSFTANTNQEAKKVEQFIKTTGEVTDDFIKEILKRTKLTY